MSAYTLVHLRPGLAVPLGAPLAGAPFHAPDNRPSRRPRKSATKLPPALFEAVLPGPRKQSAPGVDRRRYEDYAANLPRNLKDLYAHLKSGCYQAPVIRRAYIPNANGKRRPLGISTIEDRLAKYRAGASNAGAVERAPVTHGAPPGARGEDRMFTSASDLRCVGRWMSYRPVVQSVAPQAVAQADAPCADDGFRPVSRLQLRQNVRHMVGHGLRCKP
jgi:hypothetical protein